MFPFNNFRKQYDDILDEITVERSPTEKYFNAVFSVGGGLFLCFWGGLLLFVLAPWLIAIPTMTGTELLYVAACFVVCGIIFLVGAVLILQSKTPPLMKRFFYGMLSLPTAMFGLWLGWLMILEFGFAQILLSLPSACIVLGIHWARLAFKKTSVKHVIADQQTKPSFLAQTRDNPEH